MPPIPQGCGLQPLYAIVQASVKILVGMGVAQYRESDWVELIKFSQVAVQQIVYHSMPLLSLDTLIYRIKLSDLLLISFLER